MSVVEQALLQALKVFGSLTRDARSIEHVGSGFGEVGTDTELVADRILGQAMQDVLGGLPFKLLCVEGLLDVHGMETNGSNILRVADPLDGSLNFFRSIGTVSLPFSAVAAEFAPSGANVNFGDCTQAGVVDLRTGDLWFARHYIVEIPESPNRVTLNNNPIHTSGATIVDKAKGSTIIGEFYYPENRERLVRAFQDFRGYLRNPGSAGYELALVASGQVDAFICDRQKNDVLGAGYRLITSAGGFVCDFEGNELGSMMYDFNAQQSVVAAATKELAFEIVERLRR
jgi:fructose-1,6-bisphosphatase/inositol monophosphatase family enzyme